MANHNVHAVCAGCGAISKLQLDDSEFADYLLSDSFHAFIYFERAGWAKQKAFDTDGWYIYCPECVAGDICFPASWLSNQHPTGESV